MRLLTALGVIAVLAGFLVLFVRGLAGTLDLTYVAVTLVGLLGLVQGIRYTAARRGRERNTLVPAEPERRERAAVPGQDVDDRIDRASGGSLRRYELRDRLRSRVRSVAISAIARDRNCSRERASELVETGSWTDDRTAAAFLASDVSYPIRVRLRVRLFGRSRYRIGLSATVDEVGRLEASDVDDDGGWSENPAETSEHVEAAR